MQFNWQDKNENNWLINDDVFGLHSQAKTSRHQENIRNLMQVATWITRQAAKD